MSFNVNGIHTTDAINVMSLGINGNGVYDNSSSIIKMLNSGYKKFYFPAGTYIISKTIDIPNGIEIFGDGEESILKLSANPSLTEYPWRDEGGHRTMHPIIYAHDNTRINNIKLIGDTSEAKDQFQVGLLIKGNNIVCSNFSTENINYFPQAWIDWVDGQNRQGYGPNNNCPGYGIFIFEASNVRVYGGSHKNCGYQAIGTDHATDVVVDGLYCGDTNAVGLQIHRTCKRIVFTNCIVNNNGLHATDFTMHGAPGNDGCEDLIISNCIFVGDTTGLCLQSVWGCEKNVLITGCKLKSKRNGIRIHVSQVGQTPIGSSAKNFIISNNIISAGEDTDGYGIDFRGDFCTISNNVVFYRGEKSIDVTGSNKEISGNLVILQDN